ncbi:WD40-repeat-containing domain protein [Globomyces pollinis-pini]|nr:WD40-repeat-containing domain protein [Globomyces pollinis-pini]
MFNSQQQGKRQIAINCCSFSSDISSAFVPLDIKEVVKVNYGFLMAVGDQRGNIYCMEFIKNKFWIVSRTGVAITTLEFNKSKKRELIVALADYSIHCYNIDTCQLIAKLPAIHQDKITILSIHPTKSLLLSTSVTEAILWNTETWERKRILEGPGMNNVQHVEFSADGTMICAAFEDASVYFWTVDTFSLIWKITLSKLGDTTSETSLDVNTESIIRNSYFALSNNGELFVYTGTSSTVYVWNLFEKRLLHEIIIPAFESKFIQQVSFISSSNILVLLSNVGEIMFVDAFNAKFISQLRSKYRYSRFSISPDGRCLSTLSLTDKSLVNIVRLDEVLDDFPIPEKDIIGESQTPVISKIQVGDGKEATVVEKPKTFYELIESKQESTWFNRTKLRRFLHHYGSYPDHYRPLIWRFLLKLPENRGGYESLLNQGTHPSFKNFRKKYPLKSDRAAKSMERILSCLAFWSPIFEDLDYLPSLVFPFVKLFWNDLFSCLETVMTILMNWCQKWWEYYPNPPLEILEMCTQLLAYHDPDLLGHFEEHKITSQIYIWILIQTLFSESFSKSDWLTIWDHMVSNDPSFIYYFLVGYLIHFRKVLMRTTHTKDFYYFFQRRQATNISTLLLKVYEIKLKTPTELDVSSFISSFKPMEHGEYPIFNQYPQFIVNYQTRMKDKIRQEEQEYLRKRQLAAELSRLTEELRHEKKQWESSDWKMNEMIEKWWSQMTAQQEEREKLKAEMNFMEQENKVDAMTQISAARKSFMEHQQRSNLQSVKNIERSIGQQSRSESRQQDLKSQDGLFDGLETEWAKRREEMIQTRKDLSDLQTQRLESLISNVEQLKTDDTYEKVLFPPNYQKSEDSDNEPSFQKDLGIIYDSNIRQDSFLPSQSPVSNMTTNRSLNGSPTRSVTFATEK